MIEFEGAHNILLDKGNYSIYCPLTSVSKLHITSLTSGSMHCDQTKRVI